MNWKLIFQLSVFGLIMAFATISLIPPNFEPIFWFVIFVFCAYVIAKVCTGKYFLQGFFVTLINCVWVTSAHLIFYKTYIINHPQVAAMYAGAPAPLNTHPRLTLVIMGTLMGACIGLLLPIFAFIASKIVKKNPA